MITLGIDPGTRKMGYGLVEGIGSRLIHIENGAIITKTDVHLSLRLKQIYDCLTELIEKYQPDVVSIEDIFYAKNVKSALKLGHARGVAMLAGANAGLEVFEYTPTAIKSAVVGFGRAEKGQVQQMVKMLLNLPEPPQEDAADALAAAICHINTAGTQKSNALLRQKR